MKTHVIILAQGQQKRLPALTVAKQMLHLPACGGTPILHRTIRQCWSVLSETRDIDSARRGEITPHRITVVCWPPMSEELTDHGIAIRGGPMCTCATHCPESPHHDRACCYQVRCECWCHDIFHPDTCTLPDPGNSSLKGVDRFLRRFYEHPSRPTFERTVVLFGDTVYSWRCLQAIFDGTHWHCGFVGTSDLSQSGGELWGVSWEIGAETVMLQALVTALGRHPAFAEYQPGQMRRWLWEIDRCIDGSHLDGVIGVDVGAHGLRRTWYRTIDDYTRDIDLPEHVEQLSALSELAASDDALHGVTW